MESGQPHFSTNVITTSADSYPSPSAVSPHHLQHGSSIPQTLPPLQPNNLVMQQSAYSGYPTPRTPATPNTPGSTSSMASYPPPPSQNGGRGAYPMMANNPYQQTQQSYGTSSSMMPQATTAPAHAQPIAPAPTTANRVPSVLRPMPAGGVVSQTGMNSPYAQSPLMPQPSMLPEGEPTHVVGSQGRRGILPSAPGRPAAPAPGTTTAKPSIPQKDADGKFPCPHCTKTYLHAKHLKRHLLRHTGDRPYMCVLCRDTFSRSDILKRHFQKCSIRRGNPTGASHLSHPQAHVKKNAAAQQKAMGSEGDVNHINGMGNMPPDGMVHPFGLIPNSTPDGMSNIANEQAQLSRSSSINNRIDDANRDRRSMPSAVMGTSQGYNGDVSNNLGTNINPQLGNYNMSQSQNGLPMFGGSNAQEWSQMFGAQNDLAAECLPPNVGQTQTAIKPEPDVDPVRLSGIPANNTIGSSLNSRGTPDHSIPYQQLSSDLVQFLCRGTDITVDSSAVSLVVTQFFQPENIPEFIHQYAHFHMHFSILHMPTLRAQGVCLGLLAAICCVGACYSDRVAPRHVRDVMNLLRNVLEADSQLLGSLSNGTVSKPPHGTNDAIEELQAMLLVHILFTWHGTPSQRDLARQSFPRIAIMARHLDLLQVSKDPAQYSLFHQSDCSPQIANVNSFSWSRWVQCERRIRTMHVIFLCDASLGLFFNSEAQFGAFDIRLPLPADDAAWDADDEYKCAAALGLHGSQPAIVMNPDGTQRCSQPLMHLVLKAYLENSHQAQPGVTNLYAKFVLIHALLALIRQMQLDGSKATQDSSIRVPQNAWLDHAVNSGRSTPVDRTGTFLDDHTSKTISTALDKFKTTWYHDMAAQFPPTTRIHSRRYVSSKNGIHFCWLATYLLRHSWTDDPQAAAEQRFARILHLLKSVESGMMPDGVARGEEPGPVGDINGNYGVSQADFDMAQLFPSF